MGEKMGEKKRENRIFEHSLRKIMDTPLMCPENVNK